MELLTILNHCHRHRGFVYQHARFGPDQKSIEVDVRPREGSAAVCSGCHQPAPGYDHLPERCFEFIPLWGFLVFLLYRMRRADCRIEDEGTGIRKDYGLSLKMRCGAVTTGAPVASCTLVCTLSGPEEAKFCCVFRAKP